MGRVLVSLAIAVLTAAISALMFLRSMGAFGPIATSGERPKVCARIRPYNHEKNATSPPMPSCSPWASIPGRRLLRQ